MYKYIIKNHEIYQSGMVPPPNFVQSWYFARELCSMKIKKVLDKQNVASFTYCIYAAIKT